MSAHDYRDQSTLASGAQWMLHADAALAAAAILLLWSGRDMTDAAALFWLVQLVVYVATAIVFFVWLHRANANARALGADDMMASPGWAVGWYFVPLANLAMPFVTMRELWKASAKPKDWQAESAPALLGLWWACWLVAGITGMIGFRLELEFAQEAGGAGLMLATVSELFEIPSALLLAWIVRHIQGMQHAARGSAAATVFV